MGGPRRYPYPKWVWSPMGGWWPNPKNSGPKAAAISVVYAGVFAYMYFKAEDITTVYQREGNTVTFPPSDARSVAADAYNQWRDMQEAKMRADK